MKRKLSVPSNNNMKDGCDDHQLKKVILLTSLENCLSKASILESMLRTLEVLEEIILHYDDDSSLISASMRSAYCSIAVECTLKYLEVGKNHPSYLKAVHRIWRIRFHYMEKTSLLFSDELKQWRARIFSSLSNPLLMESLSATLNTRRDAINNLKFFLSEARSSFGVCLIDSAALEQHQHIVSQAVCQTDSQLRKGKCIDPLTKIDSVPTHEVPKIVSPTRKHQPESVSPVETRKVKRLHKGECTSTSAQEMDPSTICNKMDSVRNHKVSPGKSLERGSLELQTSANDGHVPDPCVDSNQANQNEATNHNRSDVQCPSLMERNSTSRTHEWDDSIDGLQGGTSSHASRFHLPSPKRRKNSPLKKYKEGKITIRRKNKRWSQLEEETLRTAISSIGSGNWKLIRDSYKDVFEERTEVDLKDKWRNMRRYGEARDSKRESKR